MNFIARWISTAFAIILLTYLWKGIEVDSLTTALLAAGLLGLSNAIVRPVIVVLTLPISVVTLGTFLFVINGALLYAVAYFIDGFVIHGFFNAVIASFSIWLIGFVIQLVLRSD